MQNWAVEFLGVAAKKSILINRNGRNGPPRCMFDLFIGIERNPFLIHEKTFISFPLQLDPDWDFY